MAGESEGIGLRVEHRCPQCGAPVLFEETDHILKCPFCRVSLFIASEGHVRHYMPPLVDVPEETLFVPYWRYKGMEFTVGESSVVHRTLDSSALASEIRTFPPSLGVRPQSMKLRFATSGPKQDFFMPHRSFQDVLPEIERRMELAQNIEPGGMLRDFSEEPERPSRAETYHRAFLGETVSLLYLPVFIKGNSFHDALTGEPLSPLPRTEETKGLSFHSRRGWSPVFIPTVCPNCGWDIDGGKDSVVLFCQNCESAWEGTSKGFGNVRYAVVAPNKDDELYLPFWRIKARAEGIRIGSYADFIRAAKLPKVIRSEWEEEEFFFWSPAFKVNPVLFLRLSKLTTIHQPRVVFDRPLGGLDPYGANLPFSEAKESLKTTLADIAVAKRKFLPLLPSIEIKPEDRLLVFIPFVSKGSELIQGPMGFGIGRNALKFGRFI